MSLFRPGILRIPGINDVYVHARRVDALCFGQGLQFNRSSPEMPHW
jgi:hypothetical protein